MVINVEKFLDEYRNKFYTSGKGPSVRTQECLTDIITAFNARPITIRAMEKCAYMLATVRQEVGPAMIPIIENLNYSSPSRLCQVWPSRFPSIAAARPFVNNPEKLGNRVYGGRLGNGPDEGYKFRGRGIGCQLTGKENYAKFSKLLNIDLVAQPELAMDVSVGAQILIEGMLQGLFTGRKLSQYITLDTIDFVGARTVVNADSKTPTVDDKGNSLPTAEKIAIDARRFLDILKRST